MILLSGDGTECKLVVDWKKGAGFKKTKRLEKSRTRHQVHPEDYADILMKYYEVNKVWKWNMHGWIGHSGTRFIQIHSMRSGLFIE